MDDNDTLSELRVSRTKWRALLFSILMLITLALLASALSNVTLSPGEPFSLQRDEDGPTPGPEGEPTPGDDTLFRILLYAVAGLLLVILIVSIVLVLLHRETRRYALAGLILLATIIMLLSWIRSRIDPFLSEEDVSGPSMGPTQPPPDWEAPVAEFDAAPPDWLTALSSFLVGGVTLGLIAVVIWIVVRLRRRRPQPPTTLEQLAGEAQQAIETIQSGGDFKNAVLQCYFDMVRILEEEQDVHRSEDTTPREFAELLSGTGLPKESVDRLTRLFERVRYGARAPSEEEEREAVTSLETIVEAFEGGA